MEARRSGKPTQIEPQPTISDGIAVSRPSLTCYSVIEELVDDIVTVDDQQTTEAVALLLERAKLLVEPSGAVTVAALLSGAARPVGRTVAVLSGGNVDLLLIDGIVRHGLESRGRFSSFWVTVPDEPGHLARVLTTVGDLGGNVLSVDHQREGTKRAFGTVKIRIAIETRSQVHIASILEALDPYEISGTHDGIGNG